MKRVVITGGNGDIANAIGNLLQSENYEVYLPKRDELDVTNEENVNLYFANNTPDILINNAGAILIEEIKKNNISKHKNVIDVNLTAVFTCTGAVLARNKNAQIINIGSSAGTKVHGQWSSYCASKAGVIMATQCWAQEGINTICLSPGRTLTKMRKSMYPDENPDTLLKPEDFAKIVYKAINGKYKTGINLDVNINNIKELLND